MTYFLVKIIKSTEKWEKNKCSTQYNVYELNFPGIKNETNISCRHNRNETIGSVFMRDRSIDVSLIPFMIVALVFLFCRPKNFSRWCLLLMIFPDLIPSQVDSRTFFCIISCLIECLHYCNENLRQQHSVVIV